MKHHRAAGENHWSRSSSIERIRICFARAVHGELFSPMSSTTGRTENKGVMMKQPMPDATIRATVLLSLIACQVLAQPTNLPAGAEPAPKPTRGQGPLRPGPAPARSAMVHDLTNLPALKVVSPGIFELGEVRLDKAERSVSFPAVLNKGEGGMEYFLVTPYGKVHESILRTAVAPLHIHVAMVLLNAKGAGKNTLPGPPREYGGSPGMAIPGDPITIDITWQEKGKEVKRSAEEMVSDMNGKTPMQRSPWVFNGSAVWQGIFLAQQSGSLISLIPDPVALINNSSPAGDDPAAWIANRDKLPPENVPLRVTIKLVGARLDK